MQAHIHAWTCCFASHVRSCLMFQSLPAAAQHRRISSALLVDEEGRLSFQRLHYWVGQFVVSHYRHHNPRNGVCDASQRQVLDEQHCDTSRSRSSHHIQLAYVDDDGDWIEFSTNEEFVHAFAHFGTVSTPTTNAAYHGFDLLTPSLSRAPTSQTLAHTRDVLRKDDTSTPSSRKANCCLVLHCRALLSLYPDTTSGRDCRAGKVAATTEPDHNLQVYSDGDTFAPGQTAEEPPCMPSTSDRKSSPDNSSSAPTPETPPANSVSRRSQQQPPLLLLHDGSTTRVVLLETPNGDERAHTSTRRVHIADAAQHTPPQQIVTEEHAHELPPPAEGVIGVVITSLDDHARQQTTNIKPITLSSSSSSRPSSTCTSAADHGTRRVKKAIERHQYDVARLLEVTSPKQQNTDTSDHLSSSSSLYSTSQHQIPAEVPAKELRRVRLKNAKVLGPAMWACRRFKEASNNNNPSVGTSIGHCRHDNDDEALFPPPSPCHGHDAAWFGVVASKLAGAEAAATEMFVDMQCTKEMLLLEQQQSQSCAKADTDTALASPARNNKSAASPRNNKAKRTRSSSSTSSSTSTQQKSTVFISSTSRGIPPCPILPNAKECSILACVKRALGE
jgi:hypothetical protein